eukprot:TRINITY_DN3969_c0_g1_i1.p1 TRINITY_DN3969_c0_g1~~TRINITY_DN3969_c0_g1_i1.p1  ORF type:complete len:277 (-),score=50.33 TRINITY_DN3969_c0_g1_i1:44-874(-)
MEDNKQVSRLLESEWKTTNYVASTQEEVAQRSTAPFRLFYWPGLPGRGEFIRLIFEETQTPYDDVLKTWEWNDLKQIAYLSNKDFFALPALRHGDILLSQTHVICKYLAKAVQGGQLHPKDKKLRLQADILMAGLVDWTAEGHDAWHPIDKNGSYDSQKDKAGPWIETYNSKRLPRWLRYYERLLSRNTEAQTKQGAEGKAEQELYFLGNSLTYVDLCVFHVLDGNEFQCKDAIDPLRSEIPLLLRFHQQIKSRTNIAAYLESSRRCPFTGTGPIF